MQEFQIYLKLGIHHILDIKAYDHLLFVLVLCAGWQLSHFKKVLLLVTAFTIGHSITLAVSAFNVNILNAKLVEILIPITIMLSALFNVALPTHTSSTKAPKYIMWQRYIVVLCFGFIHGMGFANNFKTMVSNNQNIVFQLLSFNVGIEIGQCVIILFYFIMALTLVKLIKWNEKQLSTFISGMGFGIALILLIGQLF